MARPSGLSPRQYALLELICDARQDRRLVCDENWLPIAGELLAKGLIEAADDATACGYRLTEAGRVLCGDLWLHREYNRRMPPGWRT